MTEPNPFQNAHDFVMNNPQFTNYPQIMQIEKRGLDILLRASVPAAAYDSSEHPRHCHPGTRYRYIDQIVKWGLNDTDQGHRIFWLKGPAGVGKSSIAQSCAETLAAEKKLAAAFFFSRDNRRDNPQRLFTSIAYQWASKRRPYAEILKSTIHDDPTIVDKELPHQFYHLFVSPIQELSSKGETIPERVVIIDGLDECAGETAQQAIIEIIAASTQDGTTPFVWIFCSRLEPHLAATFNYPDVSAATHQEELTVSREIDNEICKYLTDELTKIAGEHGLSLPWPSERDIGTLINLSGGLFIYASTVVRFIGDRNSLGPQDQLQTVLALATSIAKEYSEHPLSELDFFYLLILQRIPTKILQAAQRILLATTIPYVGEKAYWISKLLGLTLLQFHTACRALHSVMKIKTDQIVFYHASFMDFMQDHRRSKQFCIRSDPGLTLRTELMQRLQAVCNDPAVESRSEAFYALVQANGKEDYAYQNMVTAFIFLCSILPLDAATLTALMNFNFKNMAQLWNLNYWYSLPKDVLFRNVPPNDHRSSTIIQPCKNRDKDIATWEIAQKPDGADWDKSYILGHGEHKCFLWYDRSRGCFDLEPYPERPDNEHLNTEHPTTEDPIPEPHTISEHISTAKPPTAEIPTPIHPITGKTHHIFTRIKFWKAPTFRRLVQQVRSP